MRRKFAPAAFALLLAAGCLNSLDANYRFSLAAHRVVFPEGELDTLNVAIYDSDIPSIEDVTWSESGVNADGRTVLVPVTGPNGFSHIVAGVHPGYGMVTVRYRDRDASLPITVTPQTVDAIDVPPTVTVGNGLTTPLSPVFRVGSTQVHRHDPEITVANPAIAEIVEVANSEPYQATVRGLSVGTTTATITSENGTATFTITVE